MANRMARTPMTLSELEGHCHGHESRYLRDARSTATDGCVTWARRADSAVKDRRTDAAVEDRRANVV